MSAALCVDGLFLPRPANHLFSSSKKGSTLFLSFQFFQIGDKTPVTSSREDVNILFISLSALSLSLWRGEECIEIGELGHGEWGLGFGVLGIEFGRSR